MKTLSTRVAILVATSLSAIGCGRDDRGAVIESRPKVAEPAGSIGDDGRDLERRRTEFVTSAQRRLRELDQRIAEAQADGGVDHARIAVLRAEAEALRVRASDPRTTWSGRFQTDFERVMADVDNALAPSQTGADRGGNNAPVEPELPGTSGQP